MNRFHTQFAQILVRISPVIAAGLVLLMAGLVQASDHDDFSRVSVQRDRRESSQIFVEGSLVCRTMGNQACVLALEVKDTHQTISLANPDQAIGLFESGNRNVQIQGTMSGENRIEINKIQGL